MNDPYDGEFPEGVVILEIIDWDDFIPLPGKIVLALLKLYPGLADAVPAGKESISTENMKETKFLSCEICGTLTIHRFYLSPRVKFVLCTVHAPEAEALLFSNKGFFTKKNFIEYLFNDIWGFNTDDEEEILSSL